MKMALVIQPELCTLEYIIRFLLFLRLNLLEVEH
jgi:hypothetical protein